MNEAAAASKALEDVANNQVIMMELVLYAIISIVLILLMDLWAGKVIGNKQSMEYKVLRIPKYISLFIIWNGIKGSNIRAGKSLRIR